MEEMALRWIERVGFPIFASVSVSVTMGWVILKLFNRWEEETKHVAELARASNKALGENTAATQQLTSMINTKLGSDPENLCKFDAFLRSKGHHLSPEALTALLNEHNKHKG